jgi:ADP-heptose:LPS heptosyltransferase
MKEWPLNHWVRLHQLALGLRQNLLFCTGVNPREQELLKSFKRHAPDAATLPILPNLAAFLAVLKQSKLFVSGDTGPLHFAAGLGVPTIALFGPTRASRWAPLGAKHQFLQSACCTCSRDKDYCRSPTPCLGTIAPESVLEAILQAVALTGGVNRKGTLQPRASDPGVV